MSNAIEVKNQSRMRNRIARGFEAVFQECVLQSVLFFAVVWTLVDSAVSLHLGMIV